MRHYQPVDNRALHVVYLFLTILRFTTFSQCDEASKRACLAILADIKKHSRAIPQEALKLLDQLMV